MARVKRAVNAHKKRREVLDQASGYRGQRSRLYRKAKEQVAHSLMYAYRDRRARKGDFRKLWIQRINAAARQQGMTYNRFIQGLKRSEEHTSELQSRQYLVCRLLLEKKKNKQTRRIYMSVIKRILCNSSSFE